MENFKKMAILVAVVVLVAATDGGEQSIVAADPSPLWGLAGVAVLWLAIGLAVVSARLRRHQQVMS